MKRAFIVAAALAIAIPGLARAQSATTERPSKNASIDACLHAAESGQTLRREKKLVAARAALLECMKPACPSMVVVDCEGWKRELDASIPSVVIRILDNGKAVEQATSSIDGQPPSGEKLGAAVELDPGPHRAHVTLADGRSTEQSFVAEEGVRYRPIEVRFELAPTPAPSTTRPPEPRSPARSYAGPIVLGGIGVAGLATFAVLGLSADSRYDSLHDRCGSRCDPAEVDGLKKRYLVADVFLLASVGALVGAGLWWLFTSQPSPMVAATATSAAR